MNLDLKNKTVLITACSHGIGEQVAIDFAKQGTKCFLISRDERKLKKLKKKLDNYVNGNIIIGCDLTNDEDLYKALKYFKNKTPNFLVHNIGGTLNQKSALTNFDDWIKVINFNVGIAIKLNNFFIPKMIKKKVAKIVHISSISAIALRGSAPYASSKTLLNSYITTLARELGKYEIVVSGVMPGALYAKGGHWDKVKKSNPKKMHDFLRHHHAIGRLGLAKEISPWVLFLCSKYATKFSTGSIINIDGGTM
jgi:3-oxoacyl-[acyl-carrier protein] reductase